MTSSPTTHTVRGNSRTRPARYPFRRTGLPSLVACLGLSLSTLAANLAIDLKPHWDTQVPLANPHKGWYHHYPDNHIDKYRIEKDSDLTEFAGMDHLYLRLAWAYLEPQEGHFHWNVIDEIIDKWVAQGLGIAFRISCRETSTDRIEQQYATPRWVMEAGAQGGYFRRGEPLGPEGPWEPVYDDPIYLAKLEAFLQAFGARYDGQPWLRYVDIGSIGDWGEGHTSSGSHRRYNYAQRKIHIDLYRQAFQKTQLVVTDDFVYTTPDPEERLRLHRYVVDQGITYRDDSILVNYYVGAFPNTYTVRSPEFFEAVWRDKPTVLELEHYSAVKRQGNWLGEPGSLLAQHGNGQSGADFFRGALQLLHATYIGYHGLAHDWIADNPDLTGELLNRCGYWFFPHELELPESVEIGTKGRIRITWENRGVAPAYQPYDVVLRLSGPSRMDVTLPSGNQRWIPRSPPTLYREDYPLSLAPTLDPGRYRLGFKLYCPQTRRDVAVALNPSLKDTGGFYQIGEVAVTRP